MGMKVKAAMRYHYAPIKMAKIEIGKKGGVITQLHNSCESWEADVEGQAVSDLSEPFSDSSKAVKPASDISEAAPGRLIQSKETPLI